MPSRVRGGVAGTGRGRVAGSGGSGVLGSAREIVTGERVLRACGHLITSRMDEKRPTYPSIVSNQRPECIIVSNLFSND